MHAADARMTVFADAGMELGLAERRRGLRVRQSRPVKVYEPALARYFGGQTMDLSQSGLRVELPASTPVSPGRVLSVHVSRPRDGEMLGQRRHMLPARVVWIDRETEGARGRLVAGLEFLAMAAVQVDAA